MHFPFDAGIFAARVEETIAPAALDSEEDQSMDPDDARDYEDQFPCLGDPARTGSINDKNLEILAAILEKYPRMHERRGFGASFRPSSTYRTSSCSHEDSARSDSGELL